MPPVPIFSTIWNWPPKISRPMKGSFGLMRAEGRSLSQSAAGNASGMSFWRTPNTISGDDACGPALGPLPASRSLKPLPASRFPRDMNEPSLLESPLLGRAGFRHAFFTRNGGVSEGPYRSLSFSLAVGDEPGNVAENLRRAAGALGVPSERIYYLSQVHGREEIGRAH